MHAPLFIAASSLSQDVKTPHVSGAGQVDTDVTRVHSGIGLSLNKGDLTFVTTGMDLETIIASDISQTG